MPATRLPMRLGGDRARLAHRLLGALRDLGGQAVDRLKRLPAANAGGRDRPHPLADRAAAIAQPTTASEVLAWMHLARRVRRETALGAEAGIGRAANVSLDNRRVLPIPGDAGSV